MRRQGAPGRLASRPPAQFRRTCHAPQAARRLETQEIADLHLGFERILHLVAPRPLDAGHLRPRPLLHLRTVHTRHRRTVSQERVWSVRQNQELQVGWEMGCTAPAHQALGQQPRLRGLNRQLHHSWQDRPPRPACFQCPHQLAEHPGRLAAQQRACSTRRGMAPQCHCPPSPPARSARTCKLALRPKLLRR